MTLREGWYLMSTRDLEVELARRRELTHDREPSEPMPESNALELSTAEALAYRDAGNLPDELGRTLRLVLHVADNSELAALETKRGRFEPDYLDSPSWRRAGSAPVNVVPLRTPGVGPASAKAWWEQPELAALESEWRLNGALDGVRIPAELRGFLFKSVLALRRADRAITIESLIGAIERWTPPDDVERIAAALRDANGDD